MSVRPRNLKNGKTVYWITFQHNGRTVWERAGTDRADAESLEARRKREVKNGTYNPQVKGRVTNSGWFAYYWTRRTNRTLDNDRQLIENHVTAREWFARMALADTRPAHILQLVEEMKKAGRLGGKSIAIVYGVMRQAYARAVFEQHISVTPCTIPKGVIKWRSSKSKARKPYTRAEAHALCSDERVPLDQRVWNALAFFTGMRTGEICGRRWRDWSRDASPLTALSVHTQYEDQPLKTDDEEDTHPRMVPVHRELAALLESWWAEGWELTYRRKPTLEDFIVPNRLGTGRARYTAWESFQRSIKAVEGTNRTVHATRHTFISVARSNGARPDVLERVTHNASGAIIDAYTHFEWLPLCEAVSCFQVAPCENLDPIAAVASLRVGPPGFEAGQETVKRGESGENAGKGADSKYPQNVAGSGVREGGFDAGQDPAAARLARLEALAKIDPEAAAPGLAACRGLALAYRMAEGDQNVGPELETLLTAEAVRRG